LRVKTVRSLPSPPAKRCPATLKECCDPLKLRPIRRATRPADRVTGADGRRQSPPGW